MRAAIFIALSDRLTRGAAVQFDRKAATLRALLSICEDKRPTVLARALDVLFHRNLNRQDAKVAKKDHLDRINGIYRMGYFPITPMTISCRS